MCQKMDQSCSWNDEETLKQEIKEQSSLSDSNELIISQ